MFDLATFSLKDTTLCGASIRRLARGARSMEETAGRIVRYFYHQLRDPKTGRPACALVRFFKTHRCDQLPAELREWARSRLTRPELPPDLRCLTLLATAGDEPDWNDRRRSRDHQAIPLLGEEIVRRAPMIAQLIRHFGLEIGTVLAPPEEILTDLEQTACNVFYVPVARGSPFVPAQETFVLPHGIASVVGFGGLLPNGDLFAVILFSRVPIPRRTADLFRSLGPNVKLAILPFAENRVFSAEARAGRRRPRAAEALRRARSQIATLEQLLLAYERTVVEQAEALEGALGELRALNRELEARVAQRTEEQKQFYREAIRALTHDKLHLVDREEIPGEGEPLIDVSLDGPDAYRALRSQVREAALASGMSPQAADDLVLAMGEAAANAIKHAVEGRCSLYRGADRLLVRVSDHGAGIRPEQLPVSLLLPGYSTKVSLGMGYTVMLSLADRIWLATGPEGTVVQLEKRIRKQELPELLFPSLFPRTGEANGAG